MKFYEVIIVFALLLPSFEATIVAREEEVPVDHPDVVRLSNFALVKLNENKMGESKRELIEIIKATQQPVAGVWTRLTLRIKEGGDSKTCEVQIWEQSWLNKTEVIFSKCDGVVEIGKEVTETSQ